MYFTVYKIINLVNGKYYIGKHQTRDLNDGYMGSGKLLRLAVKKYGAENFKKEILYIFDNENEMNNKELELVVVNESTYNLTCGGKGGFNYINQHRLRRPLSEDEKSEISKKVKELWRSSDVYAENLRALEESRNVKKQSNFAINDIVRTKAITKSKCDESVAKRKSTFESTSHQQGETNSQFNTCWVNDGTVNIKIKKEVLQSYLNDGWKKGRLHVKVPSVVGKTWITNGTDSRMFSGLEIPEGWYKGRVI